MFAAERTLTGLIRWELKATADFSAPGTVKTSELFTGKYGEEEGLTGKESETDLGRKKERVL